MESRQWNWCRLVWWARKFERFGLSHKTPEEKEKMSRTGLFFCRIYMGIACGFGEGRNHNLLLFGNGGKQIGQGELKDFSPVSLDTSFPTAAFSEILQFVQVERGGKSWTWTTGSKRFPFKNSYRSRLFSSFYSRNSGNRRNFYLFFWISQWQVGSRRLLFRLKSFLTEAAAEKKDWHGKKARPLKIVRKSVTGGHLLPFRTFRAKIFIFCPNKSGKKLN